MPGIYSTWLKIGQSDISLQTLSTGKGQALFDFHHPLIARGSMTILHFGRKKVYFDQQRSFLIRRYSMAKDIYRRSWIAETLEHVTTFSSSRGYNMIRCGDKLPRIWNPIRAMHDAVYGAKCCRRHSLDRRGRKLGISANKVRTHDSRNHQFICPYVLSMYICIHMWYAQSLGILLRMYSLQHPTTIDLKYEKMLWAVIQLDLKHNNLERPTEVGDGFKVLCRIFPSRRGSHPYFIQASLPHRPFYYNNWGLRGCIPIGSPHPRIWCCIMG